MVSLIESKVGAPTGEGGSSSQLRRAYTDNYHSLDRFDREWYYIQFKIRATDWESYFCWSLMQATVINARTVWCSANEKRVCSRDFVRSLVSEYVESINEQ